MSTTKRKNVKKSNEQPNNISLDSKHKEYVAEFFKNDTEVIPALKLEKKILKKQLSKLPDTCENKEQRFKIQERIFDIRNTILALYIKKDQYYLNNASLMTEYFKHKQEVSRNETQMVTNSKNAQIFKSFGIKIEPKQEQNTTNNSEHFKEKVINKYFYNTDQYCLNIDIYFKPNNICNYCNTGELVPMEDEGVIMCANCAATSPYFVENEKPSYKEPPKEVCYYAYKRINHYKEVLAQIQAKETTNIPESHINEIKMQIIKERIHDISSISYYKMKHLLKKLGFNKYYEHIYFIKHRFGVEPPKFSSSVEDKLINMFQLIQAPYTKHCPQDRINFLNYHYVLFKSLQLLGENTYLPMVPLLKDPTKIAGQDAIWKKICFDLEWDYYPTIM
jgi:hypothetical protein